MQEAGNWPSRDTEGDVAMDCLSPPRPRPPLVPHLHHYSSPSHLLFPTLSSASPFPFSPFFSPLYSRLIIPFPFKHLYDFLSISSPLSSTFFTIHAAFMALCLAFLPALPARRCASFISPLFKASRASLNTHFLFFPVFYSCFISILQIFLCVLLFAFFVINFGFNFTFFS